jgi:hypothetical protein
VTTVTKMKITNYLLRDCRAHFSFAKTYSWSTTNSVTKKPWKSAKATVLTSGFCKRRLGRSKDKGKKKIQMKTQLSRATDADANDGDSSWFCFLCGNSSKVDMIQCVQCRSWVHTRCAKVKPSKKKYYCSTCTVT